MGLISFLFGKAPKIQFTDDGRTRHEFDEKKWQQWKDRFEKNPEYDWRHHAGTEGGKKKSSGK